MNTDGLGTPLSGSLPHAGAAKGKISDAKDPFAQLKAYALEVEEGERAAREGEEMQMTQLGYEDVEGRAWRERVVRKMGGEVEGEMGGGAASGRGGRREVVRDVGGRKGEGVAGRTRAMGGR